MQDPCHVGPNFAQLFSVDTVHNESMFIPACVVDCQELYLQMASTVMWLVRTGCTESHPKAHQHDFRYTRTDPLGRAIHEYL